MCSRFLYLILADIFVYFTVTVAAFVYLEWWQAVLASLTAFLFVVIASKLLIKSMIRTTFSNLGDSMKGLLDVKSKVLRGASVDVHAVRPSAPPTDVLERADDPDLAEFDRAEAAADLQNLRWYEIEATIFPDAKHGGPMHGWDLDDLRLVPAGTPEPRPLGDSANEDDDVELHLMNLRIVIDGEALQPGDSKVQGPQRLKFAVGAPRDIRELTFRYYFEQFGRVRLSAGPALLG